jgi:CBS domain-containing protein
MTGGCANESVARGVASVLRVGDVMVRSPKTLPAHSRIADVRRLFSNPHVAAALLVDGARFVGVIERVDVAADAADEALARDLARREVDTVEPDAPMAAALARLDERGGRRLVVLDADGHTLRGLLCLTSDRCGVCQAAPPPR